MSVRGSHSVRTTDVIRTVLFSLAGLYAVGIVALFASGRILLPQAGGLLAMPVVLAVAALRPEWLILLIVGLPPILISTVPPRQMTALLLVAVFGFLLQGHLRLGPKSGIYPLLGIILLALVMKADVSAEAGQTADATLKHLVYYAALMFVAFHSAAEARLPISAFVNALLIGVAAAAVLQPFLVSQGSEGLTAAFVRTKFSYLAVIGFGVTYLRFTTDRAHGHRPSATDATLMVVFLALTAIGFGRAAWIAAVLIFALASAWTRRKAIWIVAPLLIVVVLTVPVVQERVVPGGVVDTSDVTLARLTSGRSVLWGALYERGGEALPFGHGWGYTWSLTTLEVLGVEGGFGARAGGFAYPHNDFLFLFLELGFLGFGLLCLFWLDLWKNVRHLTRGRTEHLRHGAMLLAPIIIVMFLVQLFDNGFAIRFVAERFFTAAGLVFGLAYARRRQFGGSGGSGSPGTSRAYAVPGA
jgi:hypothetical protein